MTKMTIEDRLYFNKLEKRELLKSYLEYAFEALLHGYLDIDELKKLFKQVDNYAKEVALESEYLELLELYEWKIPKEKLERTLRDIDLSNEYTYNYYEAFGDNYLDQAYSGIQTFPPKRIVPSLKDNTRLTDTIKGYTLGEVNLRYYFKGVEGYNYAKQHEKVIDAGTNTWLYGVTVCEERGVLRRINMIVPPIKDLESALINVHEIRHVIDLFDLLGHEFPEKNDFEERARAEEDRFIKEYVRNK